MTGGDVVAAGQLVVAAIWLLLPCDLGEISQQQQAPGRRRTREQSDGEGKGLVHFTSGECSLSLGPLAACVTVT